MPRLSVAQLEAQIAQLAAENAAYVATIAVKDKLINQNETSLKYTREQAEKLQVEVNQLHAAFDGVPSAPPRRYSVENTYGGTDMMERSALARFVGFLATKV